VIPTAQARDDVRVGAKHAILFSIPHLHTLSWATKKKGMFTLFF
jgi:hypothetical protein